MKSSIVKRSVIIGGHKTSVSLEAPFWDGLKEIAEHRRMLLSGLLHDIDTGRDNANLSSAIRVYVFGHFRARALGEAPHAPDGRVTFPFMADETPARR